MDTKHTHEPMTMQEVNDAVLPVVEQVLSIRDHSGPISMSSTPSWDSLNHIHLLSAVEQKFGLEIDANEAFKLTSVDKLVEYVHASLKKPNRTTAMETETSEKGGN